MRAVPSTVGVQYLWCGDVVPDEGILDSKVAQLEPPHNSASVWRRVG
jgi:hypothetical protein